MGQAFKKPTTLDSQDSIEREVNRLLHSYSYLLKGVSERHTVNKFDEMKKSTIHQQWCIVFPLLHPSDEKDKYKVKFEEYVQQFTMWKSCGVERVLEEPLLH